MPPPAAGQKSARSPRPPWFPAARYLPRDFAFCPRRPPPNRELTLAQGEVEKSRRHVRPFDGHSRARVISRALQDDSLPTHLQDRFRSTVCTCSAISARIAVGQACCVSRATHTRGSTGATRSDGDATSYLGFIDSLPIDFRCNSGVANTEARPARAATSTSSARTRPACGTRARSYCAGASPAAANGLPRATSLPDTTLARLQLCRLKQDHSVQREHGNRGSAAASAEATSATAATAAASTSSGRRRVEIAPPASTAALSGVAAFARCAIPCLPAHRGNGAHVLRSSPTLAGCPRSAESTVSATVSERSFAGATLSGKYPDGRRCWHGESVPALRTRGCAEVLTAIASGPARALTMN